MRKIPHKQEVIQRWRCMALAHPKTRSPSQGFLQRTPIAVRCGEKDGLDLFKKNRLSKSRLHFSEQNCVRDLESFLKKNRSQPSFSPHRVAIGPRRRKSRLGKCDFRCAKALHLHLWIKILFVRYFTHFFSCFFLFLHQFICPRLKN